MADLIHAQLQATQAAFDSVAANYDGPLGNNAIIQHFRARLWREVEQRVSRSSRLLDIGCGTGLDAEHFAGLGYEVVATDWSPNMVERTRARISVSGLSDWTTVRLLGAHELDELRGERFDSIYSDLGPLNCVPDLARVAQACALLLGPGGLLIASVMGRVCPWEWAYYTLRGDRVRAQFRQQRASVPVALNGETVWTRYYTPQEFYRVFEREFVLTFYRGLGVFLPPPYLWRDRIRRFITPLGWLDDGLATWPGLRSIGDHFLMVLTRRG